MHLIPKVQYLKKHVRILCGHDDIHHYYACTFTFVPFSLYCDLSSGLLSDGFKEKDVKDSYNPPLTTGEKQRKMTTGPVMFVFIFI